MNHKTVQRQYRHLSPTERLALVLESLGRDDDGELGALIQSCPVYEYRLQDQDFWDLHNKSRMLAHLFAAIWFQTKGQVETARLRKGTFYLVGSLFERGFGLALKDFDSAPSEQSMVWGEYEEKLKSFEEYRQEAIEVERLCISRLKGVYAALFRFCQMAQLEPHQLLAWTPPLRDEVKEFMEGLAPDIEADEEMTETIFQSFSLAWPVAAV